MKITLAARKLELNISTAKFLIIQHKKAHAHLTNKGEANAKNIVNSQSNNSTEEENHPQIEILPTSNHYFPFYYPFFQQEMYPCMTRIPHAAFNLFN